MLHENKFGNVPHGYKFEVNVLHEYKFKGFGIAKKKKIKVSVS